MFNVPEAPPITQPGHKARDEAHQGEKYFLGKRPAALGGGGAELCCHVFALHWFASAAGRRGSTVLTASTGLAGISVTIH